jgi:hypothetical protein
VDAAAVVVVVARATARADTLPVYNQRLCQAR